MSRPVKGLMIKDLRLIFSQMKLFLIIIVVWAIFMTVSLKGALSVGYIALMFSFITLSTFNYDEAEKGMSYLFTLPIGKERLYKGEIFVRFNDNRRSSADCNAAYLHSMCYDKCRERVFGLFIFFNHNNTSSNSSTGIGNSTIY